MTLATARNKIVVNGAEDDCDCCGHRTVNIQDGTNCPGVLCEICGWNHCFTQPVEEYRENWVASGCPDNRERTK